MKTSAIIAGRKRHLVVKPWRPGDPEPADRTPAQREAHRRTWGIIQLRSLWTLSSHVRTPWRLRAIRWLIDGELRKRGAEPHGIRVKREAAELEALLNAEHEQWRRERDANADLQIPF